MAKKQKAELEIDRIAQSEKYSNLYNANTLKGLFTEAVRLTTPQLLARLNDKFITQAEKSVYVQVLKSTSAKKENFESVKYTHDKTFGKAADLFEFTGKGGAPIEFSVENKFKESLSTVDDKSLREIKETILAISNKLGK